MDFPYSRLEPQAKRIIAFEDISAQAVLVYVLAAVFFIHQILHHFNVAPLSLSDALWNSFIALTPTRLVLDATQVKELGPSASWSQTHATKANKMRSMLGWNSRSLVQQLPAPTSLLQRMSIGSTSSVANTIKSNAPPGLGNWDNSCYQNSVLQGLTSLTSLQNYMTRWSERAGEHSTMSALKEVAEKLQSPYNNGKHIWTPAKLKSMSSWQQQDAQEYFSKIMDELEKDVFKARNTAHVQEGCELIVNNGNKASPLENCEVATTSNYATGAQQDCELDARSNNATSPLEGMLAQQVVCTSCGFTEGLSMIPFNCLTLPLESAPETTLESCLSEYTKLEAITGVECAKCTLLKTQQELRRLAPEPVTPSNETVQLKKVLQLPPELRAQVMQRLAAVETALNLDDFSDEALSQACQISKNVRVSSTKTRQALLARMPANLVMHVNRSVFDEMTGSLRKNYAAVRYPSLLDLGPWVLGTTQTTQPVVHQSGLPRESMWKYVYRLKAIVTHYGRHENGHYIAYRQAPVFTDEELQGEVDDHPIITDRKQQWWQLSDETVSPMSEAEVLAQGGVFMLFYERVEDDAAVMSLTAENVVQPVHDSPAEDIIEMRKSTQLVSESNDATTTAAVDLHSSDDAAIAKLPAVCEIANSEASLTEDESEADVEEQQAAVVRVPSPPSPLLMRTASAAISNDKHWDVGRFVAAS